MREELSPQIRTRVVDSICHIVNENYPFDGKATDIVALLKGKLSRGAYDGCKSFSIFGAALGKDLSESSHDPHIRVFYDPGEAENIENKNRGKDSADIYPEHWWSRSKSMNYGIPKLEYLEGNIGYIRITKFAPITLAGDTVVSAMAFLSEADGLIFDLRGCSGGDPFTVQLFESYLLNKKRKPKLLLTKHSKVEYPVQQTWSLPYVPGKRLPDVPVYVLTSGYTFSGGEDMAYTLKHHKRAVIVGERTGGGAHPVEDFSVGDGFVLILPNAYPVHPETGKNWEGSGVTPDIEVRREDALGVAHESILNTFLESADDDLSAHALRWSIERVHASYFPEEIPEDELLRYTGRYRDWVVELKDRNLYLSQQGSVGADKMKPLAQGKFTADQDYNVRFEMGEDGIARALVWIPRESLDEIIYEREE